MNAKLHMLEFPLYLPLVCWMIYAFGIEGAALAWVARVTLDAALLFWLAHGFVLGHWALMAVFFASQYRYRLILPMYPFVYAVGALAAWQVPRLLARAASAARPARPALRGPGGERRAGSPGAAVVGALAEADGAGDAARPT